MTIARVELLELETSLGTPWNARSSTSTTSRCVGSPPVNHGREALVRWKHPERGRVRRWSSYPAREETGLIVEMALGCCAKPAGR